MAECLCSAMMVSSAKVLDLLGHEGRHVFRLLTWVSSIPLFSAELPQLKGVGHRDLVPLVASSAGDTHIYICGPTSGLSSS